MVCEPQVDQRPQHQRAGVVASVGVGLSDDHALSVQQGQVTPLVAEAVDGRAANEALVAVPAERRRSRVDESRIRRV